MKPPAMRRVLSVACKARDLEQTLAESVALLESGARHVELRRALDELVADFLIHNPRRLPSQTTVLAKLAAMEGSI